MRTPYNITLQEHFKAANFYPIDQQPEKESIRKKAPDWVVKAVYPIINDECYAKCMQNYRIFIEQYNQGIGIENEAIDWHNQGVRLHAELEGLTDIEKQYSAFFEKRYSDLNVREYNEEVDKASALHGWHILKKQRLATVKPATEQYFHLFLFCYNRQMEQRNKNFFHLNIRQADPIIELEINAGNIAGMRRIDEGTKSIDVCPRTVRNHRQRLEEAGVLLEYNFRGRARGIRCHVNPQILVVLDIFTGRQAVSENQSLTEDNRKEFPDYKDITRPILIDSVDKKDDGTQSSFYKECPSATTFSYKTFYGNTRSNVENFTGAAAAESVKVSPSESELLIKTVISIPKLDLAMRTGEFDNYVPIDIRRIHQEKLTGTLTNEELHKVVIQDFVKSTAKMYRGRTDILPGCWANTYKMLLEERFRFKKVWSKEKIASEIEQYRFRIAWAHLWFSSREMQPLYPSRYFDVNRKTKKEFGFEYTVKAWNDHLEDERTRPERMAKKEAQAKARAIEKNFSRRYKYKVKAFVDGKCDVNQLINYVRKNLPAHFYDQLGKFIETHVAAANLQSQYKA